jgi:regulator of protease activity HflC (stomatin/prohibitin superfamily)
MDMEINSLLDLISTVAWVLFVVFAITFFALSLRSRGTKAALLKLFSLPILLLLLLVIALNLLAASLVFVNPEEVAVVVSMVETRGIRDQPLRSGLHWIIPVLEKSVRYPIYWQTYTMSSKALEGQVRGDDSIVARTSDGQEVALDCSVIFRIDAEQVIRVHVDWQNRYIKDLVRPEVRGIVRTLVSKYSVDEVNSAKRADLEASLNEQVRAALADKGFILDQFLLRNISFSTEYAAAVESKQVALQRVIEKQHEADQIRELAAGQGSQVTIMAQAQADAVLIRARAEAEARIIQANAESRALQVIGEALLHKPDLLTYQYINKLSPNIRVMLVPNNVPYILPLPNVAVEDMGWQPITSTQILSPTEVISTTGAIMPTLPVTPTLSPAETLTPAAGK